MDENNGTPEPDYGPPSPGTGVPTQPGIGVPPPGTAAPWLNYPGPTWASAPPPAAPPPFAPPSAAPPPPPAPKSRRTRTILAAAMLVIVAMLAGFGVGHATWQPRSTAASLPAATSPGTGSGSDPFAPGNSPFGTLPSGSSGSSSTGPSGFPTGPSGSFPTGPTGSGSGGSSNSSAAGGPSDATTIAKGVDPGLVDVNTVLGYEGAQAAGTGIVLTSSGEVLTNNHVIDGSTSIHVTDIGNGRTYSAQVVGYDRAADVAVIQLDGASGLKVASLGDSSKVAVGEPVVAIGNAGGVGGTPSVAGGSVTGLGKSITASDEGGGNAEQLTGLIEVNADIQPGDSGGPIVNSSGDVLGMDTAAASGISFQTPASDGYAIPIDTAVAVAGQIESSAASDTVHIGATAFLGVKVTAASSGGAGSSQSGTSVSGVVSGSPAASAGLAAGDVITSVGGNAVGSPESLTTVMERYHPGDSVQLDWTDSSQHQHSATVQLATGPAA